MDPISIEGLNSLSAAIQSLLPPVADPTQQPQVAIQAESIAPTGLGGFVGMNDAPIGEIHGRRIEATVVIGVKATADQINAQVAAVTNAFLAADRATLLGLGFLRVLFDKAGDMIVLSASLMQRPVTFRVLFEFLKKPTDPEGVIQQIPLNIQLQQ